MNTYEHLNINEREKIMVMLSQGMKPSQIAKTLSRSRSTVSSELSRSCKQYQSYSSNTAQMNYSKNRQACKPHYKLDNEAFYKLVYDKFIIHQWSPEQISKQLNVEFYFLLPRHPWDREDE